MSTANAKNKQPTTSPRSTDAQRPVLVIVGPTGSGKTGLAIDIAEKLGGEIISADSRAIYKDMDIGTAKPTLAEMRGIPHHGIDLVYPDQRFTVHDFQLYCRQKIAEIRARGHLPIIAGGTGLYVDSVIYDYHFDAAAKKTCSDRIEMNPDFIIIGIQWDRAELRQRLTLRADQIFTQPIIPETQKLAAQYNWQLQAMRSNIYPIIQCLIDGKITEAEAKQLSVADDCHLAKRQMTWFRRNKKIIWLGLDECREYIYNLYV